MTRRLDLSQRQAQSLIRAAKAEGGHVEVKVGDVVILLFPEPPPQPERPIAEDKDFRL